MAFQDDDFTVDSEEQEMVIDMDECVEGDKVLELLIAVVDNDEDNGESADHKALTAVCE